MIRTEPAQPIPSRQDQPQAELASSGFRLPVFLLLCGLPALALMAAWQWLPESAWLRWSLAGLGVPAGALLARRWWPAWSWWEAASFGLVAVAAWFQVMSYLVLVNSYPLGLYWSEGNRFYDYSLVFGKSLYQSVYPIQPLYNEPGRYALWGVLFTLPGLPIGAHRLWNALLWTIPLIGLGYLLAGWSLQSPTRRWHFALWVFLFLIQGPIYPTLVLSAILVIASARWKSPGWKMGAVFLAALYAGLSRWTWLAAPAAWAVILTLLRGQETPEEPQLARLTVGRRRLAAAILLGAGGLVGGVISRPSLFISPEQSTGFALKQPLLWYRLFPNATYPLGILVALALAAGPLALILLWLVLTRRWRLNWLQMAVAGLPALAFLSLGLVASTKIGGGSNLHNLDMFLITLAILSGLALQTLRMRGLLHPEGWPTWVRGALTLTVLVPVWAGLQAGEPVHLPADETVEAALQTIQSEASQAAARGEVLFMDQRQLLSFGEIQGIPLVPEYEKKYLMDQSMAGNAPFFKKFYQDLANRRFTLIISHPMKIQYQGRNHNFGEENDAWSRWVASGVLCYYRPRLTLDAVGVQLLEPRATPQGDCP